MALARSNDEGLHGLVIPALGVNASLVSICEAIGYCLDLQEVLDKILCASLEEVQAQQGSILLFDEHRDRLEMLASHGLPDEIVRKGYIPRKGSIAEYVIEHNQPLILNDDARGTNYRALDERRKIVSSMCVPLRMHGKVLGTINLNRTDATLGQFQPGDLATMTVLASQAAIFIENSRLHQANLKSERLAAIGQTVAGISHCIKNMLTGVRGGLSLLEMAEGAKNWELGTKGREILHRNIDRLSSLVLDMLDYSKEREPVKNECSLTSLVEEIFATARSEATARGINLESRLDPSARTVNADGHQIFRCVLNLVHNSLDVTPKGGSVWIGAERRTQEAALRRLADTSASAAVVLRVGDNGPGIDEENRRAIFEPFFSTKGSKGTGLGLAVTRKIIREHGGHIELETRAPEPAIFAIYLPE